MESTNLLAAMFATFASPRYAVVDHLEDHLLGSMRPVSNDNVSLSAYSVEANRAEGQILQLNITFDSKNAIMHDNFIHHA